MTMVRGKTGISPMFIYSKQHLTELFLKGGSQNTTAVTSIQNGLTKLCELIALQERPGVLKKPGVFDN